MKKQILLKVSKFLVIALFTLGFTLACKNIAEKATEKIVEKSIEKSSGEDVDIDLDGEKTVVETKDGRMEIDAKSNTWPKDIPSQVPKFDFGDVVGVTMNESDDTKGWTIIFNEVSDEALEKYKAQLKSEGFESQSMTMPGKGGTVTATLDNIVVALVAGEGEASLSIQLEQN
jgi:hypothetical protein